MADVTKRRKLETIVDTNSGSCPIESIQVGFQIPDDSLGRSPLPENKSSKRKSIPTKNKARENLFNKGKIKTTRSSAGKPPVHPATRSHTSSDSLPSGNSLPSVRDLVPPTTIQLDSSLSSHSFPPSTVRSPSLPASTADVILSSASGMIVYSSTSLPSSSSPSSSSSSPSSSSSSVSVSLVSHSTSISTAVIPAPIVSAVSFDSASLASTSPLSTSPLSTSSLSTSTPLLPSLSSPEKARALSLELGKSRQSTLSLSTRTRKDANGTGPLPLLELERRSSSKTKTSEKSTVAVEKDLTALEARLREKENQLSLREAALARQMDEAKEFERQLLEYKNKSHTVLVDLLKDLCWHQQKCVDYTIQEDRMRIGRVVPVREGHMITEMWEPGEAFRETARKQKKIMDEIRELESEKTKNRNKKRGTKKQQKEKEEESVDEDGFLKPKNFVKDEEYELITQFRLQNLKKDLEDLKAEEKTLDMRKDFVIRAQKLRGDQMSSRFSNCEQLQANPRYVLMNILGKGGFSEVYKAFDLVELRYVACKIHQLNPLWQDERKRSYTRHAVRECNIQKATHHPRVVQLYEAFGLDANAFCTVLEHCDGDLDQHLRNRGQMSEKDARCVILQVLSGLRYLHSQKPVIIHYDLKPANILFSGGEVKITDFGLSKQMPESDTLGGMELTSQGAGTYWYLPPECFRDRQGQPPKITPKVDIWSCGVIMYQMLYGVKPFGHNQTPDVIIQQKTIVSAQRVDFPDKPSVTQTCKDFIQRCLTPDDDKRPDITQLFDDPFVKRPTKK